MQKSADVVIIGAGIIGLSIGYELSRRKFGKIVIIEKEIMPGLGETSKATGGIRLQFSSEFNIRLSLISLKRFLSFKEEYGWPINFQQNGYLFLAYSNNELQLLRDGQKVQSDLGIPSRILSATEIASLLPQLNLDGLIGGSFCHLDGCADPSALLQGYIREIKQMGGELYTSTEAIGISIEREEVSSVRTTKGYIQTKKVINAAGPYASLVARMTNIELPVLPYKRHVIVVSSIESIKDNMPLVVDVSTGWYMKKEYGNGVILGGTDRNCLPSWDWDSLPNQEAIDRIIETSIKRLPCLEESGIINSYVGLRSMSPDDHAILGEVQDIKGLFYAVGFSGHGFMHAPAVGEIIADLVTEGRTSLMDISPFKLQRFLSKKQVKEGYIF